MDKQPINVLLQDIPYLIGFTSVFLLILAVIAGWIMNIISLFGMETVTTIEGILRIVGIFIAPLGSIMGYL
jgi:hypothetical protein